MNEEREQILEMLAKGKISVDEAQHLLESLEQEADWDAKCSLSRRNSNVIASYCKELQRRERAFGAQDASS